MYPNYQAQQREYARRRARMRKLYEQGRSFADIGRIFSISRQRVRQVIIENGK